MNLKISWKKVVKWGLWALAGILFLVFLIRVATFEAGYYDEKEGSERAISENGDRDDLIETEPTEEEVKEYTVAADHPRYLTVPALGIKKARILQVGVNNKGEMDTPRNIFDVGWYDGSGLPGKGGTMVIDGHNGGPHVKGVFKALPNLAVGEIIQVERGDGTIYKYKVVENKEVPLSEADAYMSTASASPERGKESVTLISCSGEWSESKGTYLSRQFVRAVLVEEVAAETRVNEEDDLVKVEAKEESPYASERILTFANEETVNKIAGVVKKEYDEVGGVYVLEFESSEATEVAYNFLQNEVGDEKVVVDEKSVHIMDGERAPISWGTTQTKLAALKKYANKASDDSGKVKVAVIDTGCNLAHEMFEGRTVTSGANLAKGYDDATDTSDDQGHGTHVAGIIADGTSSKIEIVAYKALDRDGSGYMEDILNGIKKAVNDGVDMINLSLGVNLDLSTKDGVFWKNRFDEYLKDARNHGVLVFAASGNAGLSTCGESIPIDGQGVTYLCAGDGSAYAMRQKTVSYPAASSYALAISSYGHKQYYNYYSPQWPTNTVNYTFYSPYYSFYGATKSSIAFAGAGDGIRSANYKDQNGDSKFNDYITKTGTSMATPSVVAAAAMLKSYYPDYNASEMISLMDGKATDIGPAGDDIYFGGGYFDFSNLGEILGDSPIYDKKVRYSAHVQTIGWQKMVVDGAVSGTTGQSKRVEAIKIDLADDLKCGQNVCGAGSGVKYRAHVQGIGWQGWNTDGGVAGTSGKSKRVEALQIELKAQVAEYYDIYYRAHVEGYGWLGWAKNGETAGTVGLSRRVEALQIVLVEKGRAAPGTTARPVVGLLQYRTHVQGIGWEKTFTADGGMSGTSGERKRLEAIQIKLGDTGGINSQDIIYRVHAQDYGWMGWKTNGMAAGTTGESKRLEAIEINLLNEAAIRYDVCYRTHVQDIGWQGWVKDGATAGTTGLSKRLESIEIKLVGAGANCE